MGFPKTNALSTTPINHPPGGGGPVIEVSSLLPRDGKESPTFTARALMSVWKILHCTSAAAVAPNGNG
jgi:hypothetical protein